MLYDSGDISNPPVPVLHDVSFTMQGCGQNDWRNGLLILRTILQLQNQHVQNLQSADVAIEWATTNLQRDGYFGRAEELKELLKTQDFTTLGYDKVPTC